MAASEMTGVPVVSLLLDLPTSEATYRATIARAASEGANAIMVGDSPDALSNRALIADLIEQTRLPAMHPFRELVEIGRVGVRSRRAQPRCQPEPVMSADGARSENDPTE